MRHLKTFALAGAVVGALPAVAGAADFRVPPPPVVQPIAEVASGWYLRGDIGVGIMDVRRIRNQTLEAFPGLNGIAYPQQSIGDTVFVRAGIGYQWDWLRADATLEYRNATAFGITSRRVFDFDPGVGTNIAAQDNIFTGRLSSMVLMANAYVDLGTWYGITPFVGAGVGAALHSITGANDLVSRNVPGLAVGSDYGIFADARHWSFAWAIHAGLAWTVNERLKVELAYRYMDLGDASSGIGVCRQGGVDMIACAPLRVQNITSHDLSLGMRWNLGGFERFAPGPAFIPAGPAVPLAPPGVFKGADAPAPRHPHAMGGPVPGAPLAAGPGVPQGAVVQETVVPPGPGMRGGGGPRLSEAPIRGTATVQDPRFAPQRF